MTEEEIDRYINLSTTFPYFLQELGLDRAHPLIFPLFDKSSHRINVHTDDERAILMAWLVWNLEYKHLRTTVLYTRDIRDRLGEISSFEMPVGHVGEPPSRPYVNQLKYEGGSQLWFRTPGNLLIGTAMGNVIIDNIDPDSETYMRLAEARPAVVGRFITIW